MANLINGKFHLTCDERMLRSGTQPRIRGPGAIYGQGSFHCIGVTNSNIRLLQLNRTRAQERSDQGAASASAAEKTAAISNGVAQTAEGGDSSTSNGVPRSIYTEPDTSYSIQPQAKSSEILTSIQNEEGSSRGSGDASGSDNDSSEGLSPVEVATATSFIEKLAGALVMYGLTVILSNLSGVDATTGVLWKDGAPLAIGAAAAAPVILAVSLLFLPSLDVGFKLPELRAVSEVDRDEDAALVDLSGIMAANLLGAEDELRREENEPPMTLEALKQGLWLYQIHVLKPWYPAFRWSSVGALYLASCTTAGAQELLVRGYGGTLLTGFYNDLLAATTDVNNPIYWAKVFKLVTPDSARWLAALSLIALQVALSSSAASRASAFTRTSLNRIGRVPSEPKIKGVVVQNMLLTLGVGEDNEPKVEGTERVVVEVPTAEERIVYWCSLGVSILLCGATNCAWAASGSLLGSYTAQVAIDGVVTGLQQLKSTRLPQKELWEVIQKEKEEESEDDDDDDG